MLSRAQCTRIVRDLKTAEKEEAQVAALLIEAEFGNFEEEEEEVRDTVQIKREQCDPLPGDYHTSPGNASSPGSASAPTQPLSVHSWRCNGVQNERIRSQQSV